MAKKKVITEAGEVEIDKPVEEMTVPEIETEIKESKERIVLLEKSVWRGQYVKLVKDGNVKVQDNPERVEELKALGWVVE